MNESAPKESRDRVVKQAFRCRQALEVYAYGMLRDRAAAEDMVQDAFIVVMEKYETFEEGTSMMAWTRAIVRRKVLQSLDRRKRREKHEDRLISDAVDAAFQKADSDRHAEEVSARRHLLEHCLSQIAERSRKLLDCIYAGDMSYEAAGESLGMKVETVRKSLYRTKAQLRACLQQSK